MTNLIAIGTWLITIACLIGTVLNIKKSKYCFYIWSLSNALWLAYDAYTEVYSRAVLDAVQLILAVWGIIAWDKESSKRNIHEDGQKKL